MKRPRAKPSRPGLSRWCLSLLLTSLVWAQVLGFVHGIAHALPLHDAHPVALADDASADATHDVHDLFDTVFGHSDETGECRLFDAAGAHAMPATPVVFLPPHLPGTSLLRLREGDFVARWAALFDARGPPLSH